MPNIAKIGVEVSNPFARSSRSSVQTFSGGAPILHNPEGYELHSVRRPLSSARSASGRSLIRPPLVLTADAYSCRPWCEAEGCRQVCRSCGRFIEVKFSGDVGEVMFPQVRRLGGIAGRDGAENISVLCR